MKIKAEFPKKLQFLFQKSRYKVARGGRSSGKSWSFARALLVMGISKPLRVLCARETQKSIKDSVHRLLSDQVNLLGLGSKYNVLEAEIRGTNGSLFSFVGLSELTVDNIKSYEGYDICWVEEGQTVSKRSWDILIPTIRKEDSEIWISYNPQLESDETHQRFTANRPDDCINVEVNWRDNPWFSETMDKERKHCQVYSPDDYDNIWEGHCRPAVEGAIYFKQVQHAEAENRICNVPYDPLLSVHVVVDLGWEDSMAIGMVQRDSASVRIIDYIEDSHKTLADYSMELKKLGYNWGKVWFPHDGFAKDVKTGTSSAKIFAQLDWDVVGKETIKSAAMSVEEGIRATRLLFQKLYIDKVKCAGLIESLKRYRRVVSRKTGASGAPLHDQYSHGADMLRYVGVNAKNMHNNIQHEAYRPRRSVRARAA